MTTPAPQSERRPEGPGVVARVSIICLAALMALGVMFWAGPHLGWPRQAAMMGGIFVFAAVLWSTEALPLFATALVTIGLEIILLANPGGWAGFGFLGAKSPSYREVLNAAADPVLLLFFGGFLLARAAAKENVDRAMSSLLLKPFGRNPLLLALGVMLVTALFSMWMSNTATTAIMITLVAPMLAQVPKGDPYRKFLVLAVPFAANIGGIGTPIGSPPNAVAIGFLAKAGKTIHFLDWMLAAVPLMILLLALAYGLLWWFLRPGPMTSQIRAEAQPLTVRGWFVVAIFCLTVTLWMTDQWHGLPAAVVALVPVIAFTVSGVLDHRDVNSVEWNILILIAGGIALGAGMQMTGLDGLLLSYLPAPDPSKPLILIAIFCVITIVAGTFMSNTATANLVLPVAISAAAALGDGMAVELAFSIALAASMSMALPISTPPNALAYGTGQVNTHAMALIGSLIGVGGGAAVIFLAGPLLRWWGVLP